MFEFRTRELNKNEIEAVGHMLEEALDARVEAYISRFGAEKAEDFIIENTKTMPVVRQMYLTRYHAVINARLGG